MASELPIVADGVWKKFRKGRHYDSLRDLIPGLARDAVRRGTRNDLGEHEFWALRDISFEVPRGQVLGIVGPNGGGKSTLLKLLTRILAPTQGRCVAKGRVGALIEVAAGFHADLTGRENVFLQGAILGMGRDDVGRRFDSIVEFAGLNGFIDTPVKRYSSGMSARLGFSIAAHLEPEVLVIDEVLGVGDASFQEKCADRMKEFKRQGVAMVFVSHNLQSVSTLCDAVLYVNSRTVAHGEPTGVLERYLADRFAHSHPTTSGALVVERCELTDLAGQTVAAAAPGAALAFRLWLRAEQSLRDYRVAFRVYRSTDGMPVYDASWTGEELEAPVLTAGDRLTVSFDFVANLARGHYHVGYHAYHDPTARFIVHARPAAMFTVEENRTAAGVAHLAVRPQALLDAFAGRR